MSGAGRDKESQPREDSPSTQPAQTPQGYAVRTDEITFKYKYFISEALEMRNMRISGQSNKWITLVDGDTGNITLINRNNPRQIVSIQHAAPNITVWPIVTDKVLLILRSPERSANQIIERHDAKASGGGWVITPPDAKPCLFALDVTAVSISPDQKHALICGIEPEGNSTKRVAYLYELSKSEEFPIKIVERFKNIVSACFTASNDVMTATANAATPKQGWRWTFSLKTYQISHRGVTQLGKTLTLALPEREDELYYKAYEQMSMSPSGRYLFCNTHVYDFSQAHPSSVKLDRRHVDRMAYWSPNDLLILHGVGDAEPVTLRLMRLIFMILHLKHGIKRSFQAKKVVGYINFLETN